MPCWHVVPSTMTHHNHTLYCTPQPITDPTMTCAPVDVDGAPRHWCTSLTSMVVPDLPRPHNPHTTCNNISQHHHHHGTPSGMQHSPKKAPACSKASMCSKAPACSYTNADMFAPPPTPPWFDVLTTLGAAFCRSNQDYCAFLCVHAWLD